MIGFWKVFVENIKSAMQQIFQEEEKNYHSFKPANPVYPSRIEK